MRATLALLEDVIKKGKEHPRVKHGGFGWYFIIRNDEHAAFDMARGSRIRRHLGSGTYFPVTRDCNNVYEGNDFGDWCRGIDPLVTHVMYLGSEDGDPTQSEFGSSLSRWAVALRAELQSVTEQLTPLAGALAAELIAVKAAAEKAAAVANAALSS